LFYFAKGIAFFLHHLFILFIYFYGVHGSQFFIYFLPVHSLKDFLLFQNAIHPQKMGEKVAQVSELLLNPFYLTFLQFLLFDRRSDCHSNQYRIVVFSSVFRYIVWHCTIHSVGLYSVHIFSAFSSLSLFIAVRPYYCVCTGSYGVSLFFTITTFFFKYLFYIQ